MRVKTCSSCGEEKDLEEFHKDRNRPDGRRSACKVCRSEKNAQPERAPLPEAPAPPVDENDLQQRAKAAAIKDTIEAHWPEFQRRYQRHAEILGIQMRWHSMK